VKIQRIEKKIKLIQQIKNILKFLENENEIITLKITIKY